MDTCYLLLGRPWLFDNCMVYDGHANTYSLKHNSVSLTLTPLPLSKPHEITLGKQSEKNLHKGEIQDECSTSKRKYPIALRMVKPKTNGDVSPLYPTAIMPSHVCSDEFGG